MIDLKELTRAEEQVMQILWEIERGVVRDIIDKMDKPKPAYNTVSTIVRILETKGFVDHKAYGKTHEYFPLVSKERYTRFCLNNMIRGYFDGSFQNLVSFFARDNKLDIQDLEKLIDEVRPHNDAGAGNQRKKQKP